MVVVIIITDTTIRMFQNNIVRHDCEMTVIGMLLYSDEMKIQSAFKFG